LFQSNLLYLNYDKTCFIQFITKKNKEIDMQVSFTNKHITNTYSKKFPGLTTDTSMSWKNHIRELTSKLNEAFYALRSIKPLVSLNVLRIISATFIPLYHIL
jgi:hypothetical protein